jgi:hypothetical protein
MKLTKIWGIKNAVSILAILSLTISVAPARAADTSGDARFGELAASIAATKAALYSATSLSFSETSSSNYSPKSAGKGSTTITVTPTFYEYYSRTYQSVDKKKTWQLVGINSHVYATNDKVYTEISDDHSWDAGYNSYMAFEIRKFSPFSAKWVVSDKTGSNQNFNAMDPGNTVNSYIEGLDAVSSYISTVPSLPDLWVTTGAKGEKTYIIDFYRDIPSLVYTYTVDPVTGFVVSFGFSTVTEGVEFSSTLRVAVGDAVTVPIFDPASLNSIEQTEIIKKVRGLTAQEMLRTPAQLIVTLATSAAKKLRKPLTASILLKTAVNTFGSANIKAVSGGARFTGTYEGEVGYLCVLVKKAKVSIKGCK